MTASPRGGGRCDRSTARCNAPTEVVLWRMEAFQPFCCLDDEGGGRPHGLTGEIPPPFRNYSFAARSIGEFLCGNNFGQSYCDGDAKSAEWREQPPPGPGVARGTGTQPAARHAVAARAAAGARHALRALRAALAAQRAVPAAGARGAAGVAPGAAGRLVLYGSASALI